MSIGSMEVKHSENGLIGRGRISTIKLRLAFMLQPVPQERDNAPTHRVLVKSGEEWIQVGDAWENAMKRGEFEGRKMFSIRFTDPDLPEWTGNIAAFPTGAISADGDDQYDIVRQRERQDAA